MTAIVDLRDGERMISGSYDKKLNIYGLNQGGKLLYDLPTNKSAVTGIVLTHKGSKMVSIGLDNTLRIHKILQFFCLNII